MKTVIITGIGKGIGEALAEKFLSEGWRVIGTALTSAIELSHPNLTTYQLDLSVPASIAKRASQMARMEPPIDVLINNAGAIFDEDDTRLSAKKLRKTLEVNLIGTADFTEKVLSAMDRENGHVVFVSSAAGSLTQMDDMDSSHFPYHYPAYKISKCALNMYARTLAAILKKEGAGIIISSVHPGWVRTDMGGEEAPVMPEEAAEDIYKLAVSRPETGQFWYKGNKHPW